MYKLKVCLVAYRCLSLCSTFLSYIPYEHKTTLAKKKILPTHIHFPPPPLLLYGNYLLPTQLIMQRMLLHKQSHTTRQPSKHNNNNPHSPQTLNISVLDTILPPRRQE